MSNPKPSAPSAHTSFRVLGKGAPSTPQRIRIGWGDVIATARKGAGLTLRELANRASCAHSTLHRIEQGYHNTSVSGGWVAIYVRIFRVLGMELIVT